MFNKFLIKLGNKIIIFCVKKIKLMLICQILIVKL